MSTRIVMLAIAALAAACNRTPSGAAPERDLLAGAWSAEQARVLLDKTHTIRLAPDLAALTAGEQRALRDLLEVGGLVQSIYEDQLHAEAGAARAQLARRGAPHLRTLYRLCEGPIATTLANERVPFLAADPPQPGRNVYPWRITRDEVDRFLHDHPDQQDAISAPRSVVRRAADAEGDLAVLDRHPVLDALHPGLRTRLELVRRGADRAPLYALPYSVAYGDRLVRVHELLARAADALAADDPEFAGYLRNRGRDLLSDDYESGDASWVSGRFRHLNAQIGSYETYDDALFGVKSFFATSLLVLRAGDTDKLRAALGGLQAFEDSLPYQHHKRVRENIPVGVYDVIADFGQARGGNTASILPNDPLMARRYGRIILLRANIMRNPEIAEAQERTWRAVMAPAHAGELTPDGEFQRTLWHEIGHYLGVDRAGDGRELGDALGDDADLLEEMKADLVSLYVAEALRASGYYDDDALRSVEAAGILRVLLNNKPRRDQPYQTMSLIQWNFFLEQGLLRESGGALVIDHARYHTAVGALLARVLELQYRGDKAAADRFVEQYTRWDDALHGAVATHIRDNQRYRFAIFNYAALGE